MKGIKKYSHKDRDKVIQEMIPLIKRKFGRNLIALAAQASYARNEDVDYSDLELIAYIKKLPKGNAGRSMGKIRDGLLVELVWTTRDKYISEVKEVTSNWYIAGSDTLLPIINEKFINELNNYQVKNLRAKCMKQVVKHWPEVQESTAKALNAIRQKNREGMPLLVFDMLVHMLIILSFLNHTPYITFARFITQARSFKLKPKKLDELLNIIAKGDYQDLSHLNRLVSHIFEEFEKIIGDLGYKLYDNNVDPNIKKL